MTTTEQLIFVCEKLLGWKYLPSSQDGELEPCYKWMSPAGIHAVGQFHDSLPPLTLDLIWECEEKLDDVQQRKYAMIVHKRVNAGDTFGRGLNYFRVKHATKEECLAALVETIKGTQ